MATTIKSTVITVCLFVVALGLYRYTQTLQERQNSPSADRCAVIAVTS